jgi:hypothetical protein
MFAGAVSVTVNQEVVAALADEIRGIRDYLLRSSRYNFQVSGRRV